MMQRLLTLIRFAALLGSSSWASEAASSSIGFQPATPNDGPLMTFVRPEDQNGNPHQGNGRFEAVYWWSPGLEGPAKLLYKCRSARNLPKFLHRVDSDRVLISILDRCQVLNMPTAILEPLWPGDDQTKFIKGEGDSTFFLYRSVPDPKKGIKIEKNNTGVAVATDWYRPRDFLYVAKIGHTTSREVLYEQALETICLIDDSGFWAITADEPRELIRLTNGGEVASAIRIESNWIAEWIEIVPSPDGKFLALSVLRNDQSFNDRRDLVLARVSDGKLLNRVNDVVTNIWLSSITQPINMNWLDSNRLFFKNLNLETPKLGSMVLDANQLAVRKPTPAEQLAANPAESDQRERVGHFETEFGKVWFAGDTEPAGNVLNKKGIHESAELKLSDDGRWAAFSAPFTKGVFVLDGEKRSKHKVLEGWIYGLWWLPALKP
jgi:hypothetical protein